MKNNIELDFLKVQYQVLSNKQLSHNSLVWNALSLLFVAIAFLWNIALDNEIHIAIRCVISFVSVLIAFASLQNFIRNRIMEVADSEQLVAIERLMMSRKDITVPAMIVHHKLSERTMINQSGQNEGKLETILEQNRLYNYSISHWRTFYIWMILFGVILLITVILFGYNLCLMIKPFFLG